MLELSYHKHESLKILSLIPSPRFQGIDPDDEHEIEELVSIAVTVIVAGLNHTYEDYPARQLKILGQLPLDRRFFEIVGKALTDRAILPGCEVTSHNGWLVVEKPANWNDK